MDRPDSIKEVRCPAVLQFKVIDGNRIEVKCRSYGCTHATDVVLHRFSFDGALLETLRFKDPARGPGALKRKARP